MIVLKLFKTRSGLITGFELSGHSGAGKSGNDIICASVSSAAYMVVNTITDVMNINAQVKVDDGYMELTLTRSTALIAQDLLKGFELHISSLAKDYPKNIKVKYGGVRNA